MATEGKIIAITGGIGSGKSVVSRIVAAMGFDVYDCDSRAKKLMDSSRTIKDSIAEEICREAIDDDGHIDRRRLADAVFGDAVLLNKLNGLVHAAVREDFATWIGGRSIVFVETAILYQSRLDEMVDEVWEVIAPREMRVERVMSRNGISREDVELRIDSQDRFVADRVHGCVHRLVNDGFTPVLPRIESLLGRCDCY